MAPALDEAFRCHAQEGGQRSAGAGRPETGPGVGLQKKQLSAQGPLRARPGPRGPAPLRAYRQQLARPGRGWRLARVGGSERGRRGPSAARAAGAAPGARALAPAAAGGVAGAGRVRGGGRGRSRGGQSPDPAAAAAARPAARRDARGPRPRWSCRLCGTAARGAPGQPRATSEWAAAATKTGRK